jgi:hypothetical protein
MGTIADSDVIVGLEGTVWEVLYGSPAGEMKIIYCVHKGGGVGGS